MYIQYRSLFKPSNYSLLIHTYRAAYTACKRQWDEYKLEQFQEERLKAIVKHAYDNTTFYHRQFNLRGINPEDIKTRNDLPKLPILTKKDLREQSAELVADNINLHECTLSRTSGSTGNRTMVIQDKDAAISIKGAKIREQLGCEIRFGSKVLVLRSTQPPWRPYLTATLGFQRMRPFVPFLEGKRDLNIKDYLLEVRRFRPDAFYGSPLSMMLFADATRKEEISDIQPKVIISDQELLDKGTRQYISDAFNAEVFDHYGASEVGTIAWECPAHMGYHINADNVIVEILKENDEPAAEQECGNIVITFLHNFAMPLIRYKIGDVGSFTNESCPCGRKLPLLKTVEGRAQDIIVLPDGRLLHPLDLIGVMYRWTKISNFQIIQETERLIVIKYAQHLGFTSKVLAEIRNAYSKLLSDDVEVKLVSVASIPLEQERKFRSVISKVRLI